MNRQLVGRVIALPGLLFLLANAVDYLTGIDNLPGVLASIGIALILIGATLAKQEVPPTTGGSPQ